MAKSEILVKVQEPPQQCCPAGSNEFDLTIADSFNYTNDSKYLLMSALQKRSNGIVASFRGGYLKVK
jgi:hypothetical protein